VARGAAGWLCGARFTLSSLRAISRWKSVAGTTASAVGLTLTLFFLGFGGGQLVGGPLSDRYGRRMPMIVGGIVCTLGGIGCALAPSIEVLVAMRLVQGVGGGIAATVARAVVIDVARGEQLARVMSLLMALGGLADGGIDHDHPLDQGLMGTRQCPGRQLGFDQRAQGGQPAVFIQRREGDGAIGLHGDLLRDWLAYRSSRPKSQPSPGGV